MDDAAPPSTIKRGYGRRSKNPTTVPFLSFLFQSSQGMSIIILLEEEKKVVQFLVAFWRK